MRISKMDEYSNTINKIVEILGIEFLPTYNYQKLLKVLNNLVRSEIEKMENK